MMEMGVVYKICATKQPKIKGRKKETYIINVVIQEV